MSRALNAALLGGAAILAGCLLGVLWHGRRIEPARPVTALPAPPKAPPGPAANRSLDRGESVYVATGHVRRGDTEDEIRALLLRIGKRDAANDWWTSLVRRDERTRLVPGFWIDRTEVTNRRYGEFLDATGRPPPAIILPGGRVLSDWRDGRIVPGREDHPVVGVSWHEADAFASFDGGRLPTEIEWERAARGDDGRAFPWGDEWDERRSLNRAWHLDDTLPAGEFPEGASPFLCLDMAGNAWEWTASDFVLYPGNGRATGGEAGKAVRGGGFMSVLAVQRSSVRIGVPPTLRTHGIGFRTARDERALSARERRARSAPGRE